MVKKVILLVLLLIISTHVMSQEIDTISVKIRFPTYKNIYFGRKKMFLILNDGVLLKNQIKVHDTLISSLGRSHIDMIYLKVYSMLGTLRFSGLWNEGGFQDSIIIYRRNGTVKK